jgi:asparagine synthase (glutamine-hydrolysing)
MASCERLQREGVRVLLTGEGGDDWLAGRREHWPDLVRKRQWRQLFREGIAWRRSVPLKGRLRSIASEAIGPLVSERRRDSALRSHLDFSDSTPAWINADWARRIQLQGRWRQEDLTIKFDSYAQSRRFHNYEIARRHVNWENVLSYADGHGLEIRHPFHDLRLTHFLMGAHGGYLRHGDESKHLLRESMRGTLPEAIRCRTGKANFTPAVVDALTERFRERPASEWLPVKMGWVDGPFLAECQESYVAWRARGGVGLQPESPYGLVWFAAAMDLWLENAV